VILPVDHGSFTGEAMTEEKYSEIPTLTAENDKSVS